MEIWENLGNLEKFSEILANSEKIQKNLGKFGKIWKKWEN